MKKLTVACFGHRQLPRPIMCEFYEEAEKLLHQHEFVEFLVGYEGEFDSCAAAVIRGLMEKNKNCSITLVLPYRKAAYEEKMHYFQQRYTKIEICEASAKAHYRSAYQIRNREMVDRADLILCGIAHESGGAWTAVRYAEKKGKVIRNLFLNKLPE